MKSLSVRYRPTKFEDCVGQDTTVKILKQQLEKNQLSHAYLFCGPSGCGKTTVARIFANEINGGSGFPIEIDGASYSGVDNVRAITKEANERSLSGTYKIFIIDECHALSSQAWQAFLKCIEETPEYTIFIFCTTDVHKVPTTIINRCMRFNFSKISHSKIYDRLEQICISEGFTNYQDAITIISNHCNEQLRDAVTYLDQISSLDNMLSIDTVNKVIGIVDENTFYMITNALIDCNEKEILKIIETLYEDGISLPFFINEYITFILGLLKYHFFNTLKATSISQKYLAEVNGLLSIQNVTDYYNYVLNKLLVLKNMLKNDTSPLNTVEINLLQIARCQ